MSLSYLKSLLVGLLEQLGFMNKKATVVLLGLDNAGKTTLQHRLKTGSVRMFVPTQRAKEEELSVGGVTFKAWDLGGHRAARHLWRKYGALADGIVFLLDAADRERMEEARDELRALLDSEFVAEQHVPLVVMANKCDLDKALEREELMRELDIDDSVKVFRISVVEGTGYVDAFQWLASQI